MHHFVEQHPEKYREQRLRMNAALRFTPFMILNGYFCCICLGRANFREAG